MDEKTTMTIPTTTTFAGEMEVLMRLLDPSTSSEGREFARKRLREIAAWLDENIPQKEQQHEEWAALID